MVLNAHRRRDQRKTAGMVVFLDGILVKRCFYADGRRGIIREFVEGEDGKLILDKWRDPSTGLWDVRVKKQERSGRVTWKRL